MVRSALTFPYQQKRIELGEIFNPLIYLPVKTKFGWQNLWFLIDSGADITTLTIFLAEELGININKKEQTELYGIGEKSVNACAGKITIQINGFEMEVRSCFIDAPDSTLLLGRLDVFDKFDISFESSKQQIVFKQIK